MPEIVVTDNPDAHRFEAGVNGEPAGFSEYRRTDGLIVFTHTEVDPRFEGRGVGSALVRAGLDTARSRNLRVVPLCPFVRDWITRHPDHADLVHTPAPGGSKKRDH